MRVEKLIPQDEIEMAEHVEQRLKAECKMWSPEQWESYLQTLEVGLKESQPSMATIERLGTAQNIFHIINQEFPKELSERLQVLISTLSEKQMFVIKKIFFEGCSERQLARTMGISRQGVFDFKKRALRRLKKNASKVLAAFPYVKAQTEVAKDQPQNFRTGDEKGEKSC